MRIASSYRNDNQHPPHSSLRHINQIDTKVRRHRLNTQRCFHGICRSLSATPATPLLTHWWSNSLAQSYQRKIVATPVLTHWSYRSLVLSRRCAPQVRISLLRLSAGAGDFLVETLHEFIIPQLQLHHEVIPRLVRPAINPLVEQFHLAFEDGGRSVVHVQTIHGIQQRADLLWDSFLHEGLQEVPFLHVRPGAEPMQHTGHFLFHAGHRHRLDLVAQTTQHQDDLWVRGQRASPKALTSINTRGREASPGRSRLVNWVGSEIGRVNYNHVTWALRRFKSPATRLFV